MMRQARAMDDKVIAKLRKNFSSISTMNQVREELRNLVQAPNQPVSIYIYKYVHLHFLSSGCRPHEETHLFVIQDFISSLGSKTEKDDGQEVDGSKIQTQHIGKGIPTSC